MKMWMLLAAMAALSMTTLTYGADGWVRTDKQGWRPATPTLTQSTPAAQTPKAAASEKPYSLVGQETRPVQTHNDKNRPLL